ncbi:MAG: hypothetical protein LBP20_10675, partial [Treponema sp.]|nr:hypothetical protein [Treponema sp.]
MGDIDLVWGKAGTGKSDGFGLSKIVEFHPEVLDDLQRHLEGMIVKSRSANRIKLESPTHEASISLNYQGESKTWLLTEYEKEGSIAARSASTMNVSKQSFKDRAGTTTPTASDKGTIPKTTAKVKDGANGKPLAAISGGSAMLAAFGITPEQQRRDA